MMFYGSSTHVAYFLFLAHHQAHTVLEMNYSEQQLSSAVTSQGLRPVLAGPESGAPPELVSLIENCWEGNPAKRPSFNYIVEALNHLTNANMSFGAEKISKNPSVSVVSGDVNSLDSILNYTQQKRTDVNWATRVVEGFGSATVESSGWLAPKLEDGSYLPVLSIGSFATKGARQTMEDTYFLKSKLGEAAHVHAFGVFDGHRGKPLS